MTHDKELELAAEQYAKEAAMGRYEDCINDFKAGADFQKSRAEVLVETIELVQEMIAVSKRKGHVDEDYALKLIREALKNYRGGE